MTERWAADDPRYVVAITAVKELLVFEEARREHQHDLMCPTCGTDVAELRREIREIHQMLARRG